MGCGIFLHLDGGSCSVRSAAHDEKKLINHMHGSVISNSVSTICSSKTEISSAYPTSGGLYWYAARLSSRRYAPFASWMTGWFNLIGQFAVTAGIDYGIALMLGAVIEIGTNGAWVPTVGATVGMHIAICVTHGIANSLGPKVMTRINCKSLPSLHVFVACRG